MSSICLVIVVVMVAINADTKQCTTDSICECTQNEACILNCIGDQACKGSDTQLICKSGHPCTIICKSDAGDNKDACLDAVIDGNGATSIKLDCKGDSACKTATVNCGNATHCNTTCTGDSTCEETALYCGNAAHCDTTCTGDSACLQTALHCDNSQCSIDCHAGSSETCKDIWINTTNAVSFNCYNDCPPHISNTPTKSPIKTPTTSPSKRPSLSPISAPTSIPTPAPIKYDTPAPTKNPLPSPTSAPTQLPTTTSRPTSHPTVAPTTSVPTRNSVTANPSITLTKSPIKSPTNNPSILPTGNPSSTTYTSEPTKSPATAYPTVSSSANPTINPSMSHNSVSPTNAPNKSHTINPTKLPSVIPSVLSTKESILTTTVSDGITSTETSAQESNEKDTSDVGLGMPYWMIAVVGFGIVCCLLIVFMLCISKEKKKSYVNFESPDVNENDQQIVVRTDTRETHSVTSTKAEFNMGDLGASNSNLCEKTLNTFERGLMNNCVASDMLMDDIIDNMDTLGDIEMSNNNKIEVMQGELIDIQDSIDDINNNVNDEHVMLQEIIKMANDTRATAEGDNNNI